MTAAGIVSTFFPRKKYLLRAAVITGIFFAGLTLCETQYEKSVSERFDRTTNAQNCPVEYSSVLDEERVAYLSEVIEETETCLEQYGFDFHTTSYRMTRTIYFPWESSRQKVLFLYEGDQCNINFYTESMYRLSDEEWISRYLRSGLNPSNQLQEAAVTILTDDVASRVLYRQESALLTTYSHENLVSVYGYCASPKQCAAAECIRTDRGFFSAFYHAAETAQSLSEIGIDGLNASDAYKEMFRRIAE